MVNTLDFLTRKTHGHEQQAQRVIHGEVYAENRPKYKLREGYITGNPIWSESTNYYKLPYSVLDRLGRPPHVQRSSLLEILTIDGELLPLDTKK